MPKPYTYIVLCSKSNKGFLQSTLLSPSLSLLFLPCATHFYLPLPLPSSKGKFQIDLFPTFIPTSVSWPMKSASVVGWMVALKLCPPPHLPNLWILTYIAKEQASHYIVKYMIKDAKEAACPGLPRWVLNPLTKVFVRERQREIEWRHGEDTEERRRQCDQGGHWSYAAASQGVAQIVSKHQKLGESRNEFSSRVSGEHVALMISLFQTYGLQNY